VIERQHDLRIATTNDADEIGELLHDFNTEFGTPSPGAKVLSGRLSRLLGEVSTFAILAGTPAVGVALVTVRPNVWYEGGVALLDELYVVPEFRNQGNGAAMIALLRMYAEERAVNAIEINVDEGDIDAQRFYERHGYSSIDADSNERAFYFFLEL
jgi:GNAT superfamily N-acetyltransferase